MIKKKCLQGAYDADVKELISSSSIKHTIYCKYLKQFLFAMANNVILKTLSNKKLTDYKADWKLLYFGLKVMSIESTFGNG